MSLVTFRKLNPGAVLRLEVFASHGVSRQERIRVLASEVLHSLAVRGLDGAVVRRYRVALLSDGEYEENPALLAAAE